MTKVYTIIPQTIKVNSVGNIVYDDVEVIWEETKTVVESCPEPICLRKIKARLQGIAEQRVSLNNEESRLLSEKNEIEAIVATYKP